VYHVLTALLATKGLGYSSHAQVLGAFNREFLRSGLVAGVSFQQIQRLFDDRQKGDYATMLAVGEAAAAEDVETARSVVAACLKHLKNGGYLD